MRLVSPVSPPLWTPQIATSLTVKLVADGLRWVLLRSHSQSKGIQQNWSQNGSVGGDQAASFRIWVCTWHLKLWALSYPRNPIRKTVLKTQRPSSREMYSGGRTKRVDGCWSNQRLWTAENCPIPWYGCKEQTVSEIRGLGTQWVYCLYWWLSPTHFQGEKKDTHFTLSFFLPSRSRSISAGASVLEPDGITQKIIARHGSEEDWGGAVVSHVELNRDQGWTSLLGSVI